MTSSFEQVNSQLAGVAAQQRSMAAAVASGELWMEAGVADRAAARCHQVVDEIDDLLAAAKQLIRKCKFGDNADGNAAALRFEQASQDYIKTMVAAQSVFSNMEATYRAAGRTVAEADAANVHMFRGGSQ